ADQAQVLGRAHPAQRLRSHEAARAGLAEVLVDGEHRADRARAVEDEREERAAVAPGARFAIADRRLVRADPGRGRALAGEALAPERAAIVEREVGRVAAAPEHVARGCGGGRDRAGDLL